ncbi:MAG: hypothetical protein OEY19_13505, partial [Gammaproteobacteria bacterium]|nr:hypothetical protein [Gammaproteobacteria bacterium]
HSLSKQAKQANVILCPGVGFDVIPTDCLASQLKEKMPDATHLAMAFDSAGKMSPGTAKTSVEGLATGGKIRKDGKIIKVPLAYKSKKIDFGQGEKHAITIPWGDVATAYYSTGIPNVEIYLPISPGRAKQMKRMNWFRWIFKLGFVQNRLKQNMAKASKGPDDEQRKTLKTLLWGEARNAKGETITSRLETANGYELTAHGALLMAKHILDSKVDGGYYTPSLLAGNKIVHQITGSGETVFK